MISTEILIVLFILVAIVILLVVLLVKQGTMARNLDIDIDQDIDDIAEAVAHLRGAMDADRKNTAEFNAQLRDSLENNLRNGMKTQISSINDLSEKQIQKLTEMSNAQESSIRFLLQENASQKEALSKVLTESLEKLQDSNEKRLERIQGVVDEKLDKTLGEQLDRNFKQVGEQLGNLYKSLGELHDLSSGVADLNKTLTNVKTRGTWGEVQLERILAQTLSPSQYEKNVATKKNSLDRVEFAIKIPGNGDEIMYLPIDSKFPADIYNAIVDASQASDAEALSKATSELKNRILNEAKTIRDKYIDPPGTTGYAIMFLPTEGLYAEVLRIDELTERCQAMKVIVAGPTTITAVLNSLQAGFRNVQLSKKSVEVMKLLEAIKAQFGRLDTEVENAQKKLSEAAKATDKLQHRTKIIQSRMRKIGEMEGEDSDLFLGIEEDAEIPEE